VDWFEKYDSRDGIFLKTRSAMKSRNLCA